MSLLTVTPVHNRRNKLNKRNQALVHVRVYYKGKSKFIPMNVKIQPSEWNSRTLKVKPNHPNNVRLNSIIHTKVQDIESWFIKQTEENKYPSLDDIYSYALHGNQTSASFMEFLKNNIKTEAKGKHAKAEHEYEQLYLRLKEHCRFSNIDDIQFKDIDYSFIEGFSNWLTYNYKKRNGGNLMPASVYKFLKNLRKFVNLAMSRNIINPNANTFAKGTKITKFVKKSESPPKFLTKDEREKIEEYNESLPDGHYLKKICECFLFLCYSGFRHSDFVSVKVRDVTISKNKTYIRKDQTKTTNVVNVPISILFNGKGLVILEKYMKNKGDSETIFNNICLHYFNRELKTVQKFLGLRTKLTTHVGRHTFCTSLCSMGVPIVDISNLAGHKNITTTMIYAKLITTDRDERLEGYFKKE